MMMMPLGLNLLLCHWESDPPVVALLGPLERKECRETVVSPTAVAEREREREREREILWFLANSLKILIYFFFLRFNPIIKRLGP